MKIVVGLLLVIVFFAVVVIGKALTLNPTSAKTAKIILDESERASEYGKKLSKMVQKDERFRRQGRRSGHLP